ncbi:RNA polymerase sigma factor [Cypionkella sp.]|uniref:RNA polymerase sigma factor n=1 Tax=Cypionkella sp. TaxID=2811411 RepID=UPI002ABAF97D|nr:RNA polymerase sigma factor [Cypionkella sp.]MDZ4392590.1 RNA polymerase sigma factor [Cypionkella sp.]
MADSVGPYPDLDAVWRQHSRRVLATLIRILRDFDLAEEALHDAFLAAARKWPEQGIPANPSAWLISAGRFRAVDRLRQGIRFAAVQDELGVLRSEAIEPEAEGDVADDQLRLIFTCCHPDLPPEGQIALTLRTVCGLTTEEIARAFLVRTPTLAQRIVRAKQRIRDDGLRYEIPGVADLPERLVPVLRVIYLVFNEGYLAHCGQDMLRTDLTSEAIRLGRLVADLLPDGEVLGLLGLMLLHDARRTARVSPEGEGILLANQDRSSWEHGLIAEGTALVERAFAARQVGPYVLQGAIAAVHMAARTPAQTDWAEILGLYAVLVRIAPSPVVRLNRAIAVSMVHGPQAALDLIAPLTGGGDLAAYHLAHAAEADMLRQLNRLPEAASAYRRALNLCQLEPERRFLLRRIAELDGA